MAPLLFIGQELVKKKRLIDVDEEVPVDVFLHCRRKVVQAGCRSCTGGRNDDFKRSSRINKFTNQ